MIHKVENFTAKDGFGTRAVHAGQPTDPLTGSLIPPLYLTSTFALDAEDIDTLAQGRNLPPEQYMYGRTSNPTQHAFEVKMAALENCEAALSVASGMSAISLALLATLSSGDHLIVWRCIYGHAFEFIEGYLPKMGVEVAWVDELTPAALSAAARPNTKAIYLETISNPCMQIPDLQAVSDWAKPRGITTIIDNTLASPALCQPRQFGMDIIVHSATKYIGGHGDALGGVLLGDHQFVQSVRNGWYKYLGPVPSPFSCWLFNRGLKSLYARIARHCESANAIANFLHNHPAVARVNYPGLADSPDYAACQRYLSSPPAILSFSLKGGAFAANQVMKNIRLATVALSLGDADTLISHPASMSHRGVPADIRLQSGVDDGLLRLSVGLEDAADLIGDLTTVLDEVNLKDKHSA